MKLGEKAQDFLLYDQYNKPFRLSENLDKNILLVFYPKDYTKVCTAQLCSYSENFDLLIQSGFYPVAINIGSKEIHKKFSEDNSLRLRILSDSDSRVSKIYGALNFFGINKRKIIGVDKNGIINYSETVLPYKYVSVEKILEFKSGKIK
ncbi:MAG: redoxin domain-containing protein [Melioribacteraceae bacterium]|nr:redoxin domain-containing protein [Melioribacteraceae bacterium]